MYANKSRSRMMSLKENLTKPRENKSIFWYLQQLWNTAYELALISSPLDEDKLEIHTLNGIGVEFWEILARNKAYEPHISFEELLEKFTDYEKYFRKQESKFSHILLSAHATQTFSFWQIQTSHKNQFCNNAKPRVKPSGFQKRPSTRNYTTPKIVCRYCDRVGYNAKKTS